MSRSQILCIKFDEALNKSTQTSELMFLYGILVNRTKGSIQSMRVQQSLNMQHYVDGRV